MLSCRPGTVNGCTLLDIDFERINFLKRRSNQAMAELVIGRVCVISLPASLKSNGAV
jgi:hypothetical protein